MSRNSRIDTIAMMRAQDIPDQRIADHLGITRRKLWGLVAYARRKGDQDIPHSVDYRKRADRKWVKAADLYAADASYTQIAQELGVPRGNVGGLLHYARKQGYLTYRQKRPVTGPGLLAHWRNIGAAPPMGSVGHIISCLTREQTQKLVESNTNAATMADLIGQYLAEHL